MSETTDLPQSTNAEEGGAVTPDAGGHVWPEDEDRCQRCGLDAYEANGTVCRGKPTALHALEAALRPSQAAEDVLSRLIAMGWEVRRREFIPNAETIAAMNEPREGRKRYTDTDELIRDLARPGWLVWVRRLLGRVG